MSHIAVIIPVHDGWTYTQKCLSSMESMVNARRTADEPQYSVVVVDDGSTDGTAAFVGQHFPWVHLLLGNGSLWWSGGINMGSSYAIEKLHADYLLLWNNDIFPGDHYFENLSDIVYTSNGQVIWGSLVRELQHPERVWSMGGRFNRKTGARFMLGLDKPIGDLPKTPQPADWLTGMGTLVPVEVVKRIGYWDARRFPQYHGDSDFTCRAREAGFQLFVHPELTIYNDLYSTAPLHQGEFRKLIRSLGHIKSKYNFRKDWAFYRRHKAAPLAYFNLLWRYVRYIGGFFKWKILRVLGMRKM
ncbi:MAG: glycosyltransferase family 2 protein [Bacteroidales bacterium]